MTSSGFGWLKYNDKIYEHDCIIMADGRVVPRNEDALKRKFGTMHAIDSEELELLMQGNPSVIIIGTGQNGEAKLTSRAKEFIMRSSARIVEGTSPKACKVYDNLTEKKAALIHVTC